MNGQPSKTAVNNFPANPNVPVWTPVRPKGQEKFQEVWYVKLNEREGSHALWLRFSLLVTQHGFQKISETWAVFFDREKNRELSKTAVKQRFGIDSFQALSDGVRVGECKLLSDHTQGIIQSKGKSIEWDLSIRNVSNKPVSLLPQMARKLRFLDTEAWTVSEDLLFSGRAIVDGVTYQFEDAPGIQSHWNGIRSPHSWVWGQANTFTNDKGEPSALIFEGVSLRPRLMGRFSGPKLSSFYFFYKNEHYYFNSLWDAFHLKSDSSITQWQFQGDSGELSFRGSAQADHKDFAGITLEDTDGSVLYCANSALSSMIIHVYRRGKIEATFTAQGTAAFEVVSRQKNPYIQELL